MKHSTGLSLGTEETEKDRTLLPFLSHTLRNLQVTISVNMGIPRGKFPICRGPKSNQNIAAEPESQ